MSTDIPYNEETNYKISRNKLTDLIKNSLILKEKLASRMNELESEYKEKEND